MTETLWVDCFPWLEAGPTRSDGSALSTDWRTEIGERSGQHFVAFLKRIGLITDMAIEERPTWSLSHIFPTVQPDLRLSDLSLTVRTRNCLSSSQLRYFSDLGDWSVEDLFDIRNMGARSVSELIGRLARAATEVSAGIAEHAVADQDELRADSARHRSEESLEQFIPFDWSSVSSSLHILAQWQVAKEQPATPLMDFESTQGDVPQVVAAARDWLRNLTIPIESLPASGGVPHLLNTRLSQLNERELLVISKRLLSETPETLDSIGTTLGVTRERVRQIESKALSAASSWLGEESPLGLSAAAARHLISPLCSLERLLGLMPSLTEPVETVCLPAWYVLDKFDDGFESDGVWVAKPSLDEVANETLTRFQEASNAHGAAEIENLRAAFADWTSIDSGDLVSWLESLGYSRCMEHLVSPAIRGLNGESAAYLSIVGEPCSSDAILEAIGNDRSITSLKNALSTDSRFVRADKDGWALSEWGTREYSNIRDMIGEVISELGSTTLDALIAELTSTFTISPRSIAAYANAWPFQTVNGMVRMAQTPKRTSKSLSESRNVYRNGESVQLRVFVNSEHLRGSGFSVPPSLALAVGLEPGQKIQLPSSSGTTSFTWPGSQPALGSIRSHLVDMDCAVGDSVMITLSPNSIDFRKISRREDESPTAQLIEILGLDATKLESAHVATALGLSPNTPWASVIHTLRSRGESDLVDLLIETLGADPVFSPDMAPSKPGGITIVAIEDRL